MSDLLNTDSGFEFNDDAVDSIDQSSIEGSGSVYPLIQWVKGDMKAKKFGGMDYQGGLFVKADKVDGAAMEAAGWTKTSYTFKNGADEEGYWRREAAIIVIAERKSWEAVSNDEQKSFPRNKGGWEAAKAANGGKKPRSHAQYMVLVKGLEHLGLFVFTVRGSAAAAFDSSRNDSVKARFIATVIVNANARSRASTQKQIDALKAAGKQVPSQLYEKLGRQWALRGFYLPFGADRDEKGEPRYTTVGTAPETTNVVLPVALGLPDKAVDVDLRRFYVGDDMLKAANEYFDASLEWRTAWENIKTSAEDVATSEQTTAAAAIKDAEDAALAATGL